MGLVGELERTEFLMMYAPALRKLGVDPDNITEEDIDKAVAEVFGEEEDESADSTPE